MKTSTDTETAAFLAFVQGWLREEEKEGRRNAATLLATPVALWREALNALPEMRGYGTLKAVLEQVHRDHFQHPRTALERVSVVIAYVDAVEAPDRVAKVALRGLARKEYANALWLTGDLRGALKEAQLSQQIYGEIGGLAHDQAKARLVEATVWKELQEFDRALAVARECEPVFLDHDDPQYFTFARMTEAAILFARKQHREALAIFAATAEEAEQRGDIHTLAICLHNSAGCARALGKHDTARDLDARALAHFERLGTKIERPRIRWTYALSLADSGRVNEAISELYKTRAEFLRLGINSEAAVCSLDILRIRFERGENVSDTCAELVRTFADAGMTQNAIEALAYLREQENSGLLSPGLIEAVRRFLTELTSNPVLLFARPPDEETE